MDIIVDNMNKNQPIKLLLFLPAQIFRNRSTKYIQYCPCCGKTINAFTKNKHPTNISTDPHGGEHITSEAFPIGGWFCSRCKLHLLNDNTTEKQKHPRKSVLLTMNDSTDIMDQSTSRMTSDSSGIYSQTNSRLPSVRDPSSSDELQTPKNKNNLLCTDDSPISTDEMKTPNTTKDQLSNKDSNSNTDSANHSPQSPSTSFTEQYDEWESQVTNDFKELLLKTRDHVLTREKVLKAHQVDLCQRERMLKNREEEMNDKIERIKESEASLKEKFDRLNIYKDAMLSDVENKTKQLIKQEQQFNSLHKEPITSFEYPRQHLGNDNNTSRYHSNNNNRHSGANKSTEHHFTVLPPVTDFARHKTERSRPRQRLTSHNQHYPQRSRSTGVPSRQLIDDFTDNPQPISTSSRDSLLFEALPPNTPPTSQLGVNRLKNTVPPNRPRPNIEYFPPGTIVNSETRTPITNGENITNLSHNDPYYNNNIPPSVQQNQHHQNDSYTVVLHTNNSSLHNSSVYKIGNNEPGNSRDTRNLHSHNNSNNMSMASQNHNVTNRSEINGGHNDQYIDMNRHNHSNDYLNGPFYLNNGYQNSNHPPPPSTQSHGYVQENHVINGHVTQRRRRTKDHPERTMSYRYIENSSNNAQDVAERKPRYSYHGNADENVTGQNIHVVSKTTNRGRSMDPSEVRHNHRARTVTSEMAINRPPLPKYEESMRARRAFWKATEI